MNAREFFNALYRNCDGIACMRLIPDNRDEYPKNLYRNTHTMKTLTDDALAWLSKQNKTYHIYHRIGLSLEERDRKSSITALPAFWVDVDDKSAKAYQKLEDLCPTMIVSSGGGYHGYWLLHEPLMIDNDERREEVEQILQGMALASGGDTSVTNINRILRTPSTRNIKAKYGDDKPICHVLYCDESWGRYSYQRLVKDYKHLGTPPKPKVRRHVPAQAIGDDLPNFAAWYLKNGHLVGRGERNQKLYAAACDYHNVGRTQSQAEIDLGSVAQSSGLTLDEIKRTIASAYRSARKTPMTRPIFSRMAIGDKLAKR